MGKSIGLGVLVSVVLLGVGVMGAFITMVVLNGFSEREGGRIMMVLAAIFFAAHFFIVSKVAKSRAIAGVLTALPALPVFAFLGML